MARILIIDDFAPILDVFGLMLTAAGHQVTTSGNGPAGLRLAERVPPDLVLLDVDLPGPNGLAMCFALKSSPTLAAVPVLMMTGRPYWGLNQSITAAGACGLLIKPIARDSLLDAIKSALEVSRLPR